MRRNPWGQRLGAWLPADSERDLFRPALADLDREHIERGSFGWTYALRLTILWLQCVQLAALNRVTRDGRRRRPPSVRKELVRMFARDLRHAFRLFRREPAFAATAVLTLMLGIGANTALFAVVEAVLLRPLPVPSADDLVVLRHRDVGTGITKQFIAIGDFVDMRQRQQSLEALAAYGGFQSTLFDAGEPIRVEGAAVAPEMLRGAPLPAGHGPRVHGGRRPPGGAAGRDCQSGSVADAARFRSSGPLAIHPAWGHAAHGRSAWRLQDFAFHQGIKPM